MSVEFEKYIVDGKVGVLVSPGYGAGWSTWAHDMTDKAMAMDKRIVEAFIRGGSSAAAEEAAKLFPNNYLGGATDLEIEWVDQGLRFDIREYDGYESLHVFSSDDGWSA
jgi:hypothetical protein